MAAEEARARLRDLCRRLLRACGRALSVGRLCAALLEPWAPMASNALPAKVRAAASCGNCQVAASWPSLQLSDSQIH